MDNRDRYLKRVFGISEEEYLTLAQEQGNTCAICHKSSGTRRLSVDHEHGTKKVRGLLCGRCNVGLGMFMDNTMILANAIDYLFTHRRRYKRVYKNRVLYRKETA